MIVIFVRNGLSVLTNFIKNIKLHLSLLYHFSIYLLCKYIFGTQIKSILNISVYYIEQTSLIFCGVRNNAANMVRTSETHESTIVHNMAGTTISFHPTKNSTYLIGTKVGLVMQVRINLGFNTYYVVILKLYTISR